MIIKMQNKNFMKIEKIKKFNVDKIFKLMAIFSLLITSVFATSLNIEATEESETIIGAKTTGEGTNVFNYSPAAKWKAGPRAEEYFTTVDTSLEENKDVYYTFDFAGTGAEIWGFKAPRHAIVKFELDNDPTTAVEVDTFAAVRTSDSVKLHGYKNLENKKHQIKVYATGKANAQAQAGDMQVSKAIVFAPMPTATEVSFNEKEIELYEGKSIQLTYTTKPTVASLPDDFEFSSGNEDIATVSSTGLITAHKAGTTAISGTSASNSMYESLDLVVKAQDDMHTTIVDSGDSYQQKNYDELLNGNVTNENLWAWKGDKAISEIALLTTDKSLTGVNIKASDFKSGNNVISAKNIDATFMKETKAFIGNAGWYAQVSIDTEGNPDRLPTGPKEDFFDVIYTKDPIDIEKGRVQLIWVDLNIPEDAKAGTYKGSLTISAENTEDTKTIDYEVEVIDANVPNTEDYTFRPDFWTYPFSTAEYYNVEPFGSEHIEILKSHLAKYKATGGTTVTGTIVDEAWGGQTFGVGDPKVPSLVKWIKTAEGNWTFDYTYFDKLVETAKSIGLDNNFVMYSPIPWGNQIRYYDEATSEYKTIVAPASNKTTYSDAWKPFFTDFAKHLDEKGWFEDVSFGFDERPNMATVFDVIDEVKNKDGKVFRKQGAYNHIFGADGKSVTPRMENLSYNLDQLRGNLSQFKTWLQERKDAGLKTTFYTGTEIFPNTFVKSKPVEGYWTMAYSGTLGLDGFLDWAYDSWVRDPLRDATHSAFQPGDTFMVYPSEKDAEVKETLSSIRSEKYEEGVRDINKLYLMKNEQPSLSEEIDALFAKVKSNYAFTTVNNQPGWVPNSTSNGRPAKWITDGGKEEMLADMATFKEGIKEISKKYAELNKPEAVDKTELQKAYDDYKSLDSNQYTNNSWTKMDEALKTALTVLNNEKATQEDVTNAIAALANAKNALVERASKEDFDKLTEALDQVKNNGNESHKELINKVEEFIRKGAENASKEDVRKLLEELTNALKPSKPTPPTGDTTNVATEVAIALMSLTAIAFVFRKKYSK